MWVVFRYGHKLCRQLEGGAELYAHGLARSIFLIFDTFVNVALTAHCTSPVTCEYLLRLTSRKTQRSRGVKFSTRNVHMRCSNNADSKRLLRQSVEMSPTRANCSGTMI